MQTITTIGRHTRITLTRGDSFYATIGMTKDGEAYTPQEGDVVTFTARTTYGADVAIQKTIPTDTLLLALYPADTQDLAYGTYVFDIQLESQGDVDTFIVGELKLTKEVT